MITNEMMERAKRFFENPKNKLTYEVYMYDESRPKSRSNKSTPINRQQVEYYFREKGDIYQPEICNKPLCRCIDIAELNNGGNPVKNYPCLAKVEPETLKMNLRQPPTPAIADTVNGEVIEAQKDLLRFMWQNSVDSAVKENHFLIDGEKQSIDEIIKLYLASKKIK